MAKKQINYTYRDFNGVRNELVKFSQEYYPEISDNFNDDSSIGSWFVDLVSDCVDSLNFHIDRVFQNTQINSTTSQSAIKNIARSNGLKIPGRKASICEVEFSCVLPVSSTDISIPDWNYAPTIKKTTIVSSGNKNYSLEDDVDFGEQFNSEGYSNRSFTPKRNSNGVITGYTVSKTAIVSSGTRKTYKKVMSSSDISPFMEILLPELNVMNVESIIFKESAKLSTNPNISEYYVNSEKYRYNDSTINTYRFFEVNSLSDQWRWGSSTATKIDNDVVMDEYNPEDYEDYTETESDDSYASQRTTRIYKGAWMPLTQKYITEYTDNGYLKIIFGSGVGYGEINNESSLTQYGKYRMSKIMNNDMLGVLPKAGWTMYVLYTVGGGVESNLSKGSINMITSLDSNFTRDDGSLDVSNKNAIITSFTVTNLSDAVAGKDEPSLSEIKYLTKYNSSSQERCVTLKDYQMRLMMMPPKYGAPFRCAAIEDNNKIQISTLGLNASGKLDKALPSLLADNMIEYLTHYKGINDYVEIKSGKIYNIGMGVDVFIDKSYNAADIISNIITKIKDYMAVTSHDMGENIFMGDLEKEIMQMDGVLSMISLRVYKLYGGKYSSDVCPLSTTSITSSTCSSEVNESYKVSDNATADLIDLDSSDYLLSGDYNAMYEIKYDTDIQIRAKQM